MQDDDKKVTDTDTGVDLDISGDLGTSMKNCKSSNPLVAKGGYIMAFTTPSKTEASQIQICPCKYLEPAPIRPLLMKSGYIDSSCIFCPLTRGLQRKLTSF